MNFNRDTLEQLSKLDDNELAAELAKQIKIKKENGTLGELEKMLRVITPFLSNEQKDRLAKIIKEAQEQNQ